MGEAKRRRDYERAHAGEIAAKLARLGAEWERIEAIAACDHKDEDGFYRAVCDHGRPDLFGAVPR